MGSVRSSRVVVGGEVRPAAVRWEDGVFVEIGDFVADEDVGDLMVIPGLVDTHVHVNEPGRSHWEGFATATRAAAAGGTTTIVDMPLNCLPPTVSVDALGQKRQEAAGRLMVDVGFWGGLVPGSATQIDGLVAEGVCGFKAFLVDSGVEEFPPMTLEGLGALFPHLRDLGVPLLVHAEDPAWIGPLEGDPRSYAAYLASRPAAAEGEAVAALAALAEKTGAAVHVVHVSSADAVAAIASGPPGLTGETCPHYLYFAASDIPAGATLFKCAPPIRPIEHREALWAGLREGVLNMVVSDHSPAPPELKRVEEGDFGQAWGGIGSLQLRLAVVWTEAAGRGVDPVDLVEWLAASPARLAGLDTKGSIEVGKDADLVLWDPDGVTVVDSSRLYHRHPVTPYQGMTLRGSVETTILRGETVYAPGRFEEARGRMLTRR